MKYFEILKSSIIFLSVFVCMLIILSLPISKKKIWIIGRYFLIVPLLGLAYYFNKKYLYLPINTVVTVSVLAFILSTVLAFLDVKKNKKDNEKSEYELVLSHERGKIIYRNPFNGFLIYGGAGSGKTASIGKPLLKEFMRNEFSIFIYDAKDSDYTQTAFKIQEDIVYEKNIYNINIADPSKSHRTNPFSPSLFSDETEIVSFADIFFSSFLKEGEKKDEWFDMALGVFKGVVVVFFKHYPQYCTLPHICNFIQESNVRELKILLQKDRISRNYASALFMSENSEKTEASILTNLAKSVSDFSANKKACYVLSGNDFVCSLSDTENPKSICVSNTFGLREIISPIVVLIFTIIAKQIEYGNKMPIAFFMDEATTFKIPNFESYPSELREYLVSFVFLTQSAGKITKIYGEHDKNSIEDNLGNHFYGASGNTKSFENIDKQFSKQEKETKSYTRSSNDKTSTTRSTRKETRFDGEFLGALKPGEFVGKTRNANVKTFHTRFKPYTGGKSDDFQLPREVTREDIEKNYIQIIEDIKTILA